MKNIIANIKHIDQLGIYPHIHDIESIDGNRAILAGGGAADLFCVNDYLGLSQRKEIISVASSRLAEYGLGARAVRMAGGSYEVHTKFESELAAFLGKDDSVTFASGMQTNFSVINAICNLLQMDEERSFILPTTCFIDQFAHASLHDGLKASAVSSKIFPHSNTRALNRCLERCSTPRRIIVIDGLYSTEGDLSPLPDILELAEKHDAIVYMDDAHGIGAIGVHLGGVADHFGVAHHPSLIIAGTLSKTFGGIGDFVTGGNDFCRFIRVAARANIFSHALPPHMVFAFREALRIMREEADTLKQALHNNIELARSGLQKLGLKILGESTIPIIPVMVGDEMKSVRVSDDLLSLGIMAPPFRYPATARGQARIRVAVTAIHSAEQIENLIRAFEIVSKQHSLSKLYVN